MTDNKKQVGQSSLVYKAQFKLRFLQPAYWGTWLAVFLLFIVNLLPARLTDWFANFLGDAARNVNKKRRRIARKNLELCFPDTDEEKRKQMMKQNFRAQMRSVLHYGLFWWASRSRLQKRIELQGEEHIRTALQSGKSVIIMTSHSVGLEAAVSAITMRYPISGPFKVMKNEVTNWLVAKCRTRFGTIIYSRDAGLRPIIKDVRNGQLMFYLPDEDLGRDRSIFVPLFGVQKATIPVLGRLAKNCNAVVLPCISCYDEQRAKYVVHVLPVLKDFPQGDDVNDAARMNQAIEQTVSICPSQYFWTLKLFRTRPQGEERFY